LAVCGFSLVRVNMSIAQIPAPHQNKFWYYISVERARCLLPGCVSQLWLQPELRDGRCWFQMDADAMISKGIAAVVCGFYQGETPADILAVEPDFLAEAGLTQVLSSNRSNALASLRRRIKAFAEACIAGEVTPAPVPIPAAAAAPAAAG